MRNTILLLFLFVSYPVFAHSGHADQAVGFWGGFLHPWTGIDHLLAMFAVGLWSATTTRRIWLAPISFAATLLLGALLAQAGVQFPAVESGVALSVLLLGILVMARTHLPEYVTAILVALFALFHGAAHGQELNTSVSLLGMVVATALLHGIGIVVGKQLNARNIWWQRMTGVSIALAGAGLSVGMLS